MGVNPPSSSIRTLLAHSVEGRVLTFLGAFMKKASDVLKEYEQRQKHEQDGEHEKDHSLQENAKERAKHPEQMNVGTPHDWEDLEAYQEELERLDREGPGKSE